MFRTNKTRETPVGRAVAFFDLLAQEMELRPQMLTRAVGINLHVVAGGICGEQAINRAELQRFFGDKFSQQLMRVGKQFGGFLTVFFVLKNFRIDAAQFPSVEERRPVNERQDFFQRKRERSSVTRSE